VSNGNLNRIPPIDVTYEKPTNNLGKSMFTHLIKLKNTLKDEKPRRQLTTEERNRQELTAEVTSAVNCQ